MKSPRPGFDRKVFCFYGLFAAANLLLTSTVGFGWKRVPASELDPLVCAGRLLLHLNSATFMYLVWLLIRSRLTALRLAHRFRRSAAK